MKEIQKSIINTEAKKDGSHSHQSSPQDYIKGKSETSDEECTHFF